MASYIIRFILLVAVAFSVIKNYYNPLAKLHIESAEGIGPYIWTIFGTYIFYKIVSFVISAKKVTFRPIALFGFTLLNILFLSVTFFKVGAAGMTGSMNLFLKIIGYLFLPFIIVLLIYSIGRKLLSFLKTFESQSGGFKFLMSLGSGFAIFLTLLSISSFVGMYNITIVSFILGIFLAISYKEVWDAIVYLFSTNIEFDQHKSDGNVFELINFKLVSAELSFIVLTFLIGVNFINIVRPMPIGWDDLGVYMNYAQIMANSGSVMAGAGMLAWQLFTGIGFMFHNTPQAFFLNQIGGILSVIVLTVALGDLLKDGKKKFLSLPIILATMFYSMPMVIFQQAKDMKLDPALFFITVIGIYGFLHLFSRYLGYKEDTSGILEGVSAGPAKKLYDNFVFRLSSVFKSETGETDIFENKDYIAYVAIVGVIVGLAFTMKITSLMLILGLFGMLFYAKLGLSGFLAYFFAFIGTFTLGNLWSQLNVSLGDISANDMFTSGIVCLAIAAGLFFYSAVKYSIKSFSKAFVLLIAFTIGIALPILPWVAKNLNEGAMLQDGNKTSLVSLILNGKNDGFKPDYTKIYSPDELKNAQKKATGDTIDSKGQASNEDLGRYFGYEKGINNYLKLPYNLTFQNNQPGEYTEITYFFLALLPIILLFLSFKNVFASVGVMVITALGFSYYGGFNISKMISGIFASMTLPLGYLWIIGIFLAMLIFFLYALSNDKLSQISKLNMVFMTVYVLIFVVAAYGIVWYGIAMYFSFLLLIGIAASYISSESESEEENVIRLFGSIILFVLISIYFLRSSVPHGFNNLKQAGFPDFKAGQVSQEAGIFNSHPDYFVVLSHLNIVDQKKVAKSIGSDIQNDTLKQFVKMNIGEDYDMIKLQGLLREVSMTDLSRFKIDEQTQLAVRLECNEILDKIYKTVLYPPKAIQNNAPIYRIGTFLTYFISNNRNRYLDDSLVFNFEGYFYDKNPDKTIERMKKLGIGYFLVDLNAATIDKDPRHNLTKRYENLLNTFRSKNLELIQTDSLCLKLVLNENDNDYLSLAGVNYESYTSSGETVNRGLKQVQCYNKILDLISAGKVTDKSHAYLLPLANYLKEKKVSSQEALAAAMQQMVGHGWLALFRIK